MGLYAEFSPNDFGFPSDFSSSTDYGDVYVEVDYSEALEAAVDVFMDEATSRVPVDTGYLRSTISASSNGGSASFSADAEYAQYPEFGTWCQAEQPYFRPALQDAIDTFVDYAQEAINEAQDEYNDEMDVLRAEAGEEGGGGGGISSEGGLAGLGMMLMLVILFIPVAIAGMEIASNMPGNEDSISSFGSMGGVDADSLVEIT